MKKCLMKDCDYPIRARSLCQMHYYRWKAGKVNIKVPAPMSHSEAGRIGGRKGTTGGFGSMEIGKDGLTGRQRAAVAGALGGIKRKAVSA